MSNDLNLLNNNTEATESSVDVNNEAVSTNVPDATRTQPVASKKQLWLTENQSIEVDEVPDWFISNKYKTVEMQAKSYKELQKKMGAFTGAPETYVIPEQAKDDALLSKVSKIAKDLNMSQEGLDKLISVYSEHTNDVSELTKAEITAHKITEMNKLGVNGQDILSGVKTWVENNFAPEEQRLFNEFATTAESIKLLAKIRDITGKQMASTQPMVNEGSIEFTDTIDSKISKLINDPRYASDAAYFQFANNKVKELMGA